MFQVHITGTIEAAAPSGQIFPMGLRKSLGAERKEVEKVLTCPWEILMFIYFLIFDIFCAGEFWKFIYEYEMVYVQLEEAWRCFEYSLTGFLWKDAPLFNGSSAFEILATGKCSRSLYMLSTERFEGGMHRCSLRPAQRMHEINPRNVTKNESNYAGQISTSVLIVQVVGSPSYCKLQRIATYCNVLPRIATYCNLFLYVGPIDSRISCILKPGKAAKLPPSQCFMAP